MANEMTRSTSTNALRASIGYARYEVRLADPKPRLLMESAQATDLSKAHDTMDASSDDALRMR